MMKEKNQIGMLLFALLAIHLHGSAQTLASFTDERDGEVYATVSYEIVLSKDSTASMTWMAENLNYEIENSYCYDNYPSNCDIMGRIYTWPAAKNACPQGWHLPNDVEWYALANLYGGVAKAGIHLKSKSDLWINGGTGLYIGGKRNAGTNKSLFNVMPYGGGMKEYDYSSFGYRAIFWSSSKKDKENAWDWSLSSGTTKLNRWEGYIAITGNSVRCVKD